MPPQISYSNCGRCGKKVETVGLYCDDCKTYFSMLYKMRQWFEHELSRTEQEQFIASIVKKEGVKNNANRNL